MRIMVNQYHKRAKVISVMLMLSIREFAKYLTANLTKL